MLYFETFKQSIVDDGVTAISFRPNFEFEKGVNALGCLHATFGRG
jgi:hypothetical protein